MKLTTLSLLSMCMAFVHGACVDWPIADDGCNNEIYLEKIICSGDNCECNTFEGPGECSVTDEQVADLTTDGLNGESCEQICILSGECVFFRWDKADSDSHCTLMKDDQCRAYLRCDKGICVSGQAGCNGDGEHTPIPDTAVCSANVPFIRGSVHWYCKNGDDTINIYGPEDVPSGTICNTAHKCAAFDNDGEDDDPENSYANDFYVICNPDWSPDGPIVWGKYGPSSNDATLPYGDELTATDPDKSSLTDPVCPTVPETLSLTASIFNEPGVSLVCDNAYTTDATTVTVTAPNACVLLCNFHHVLSFESDLAEDGTGVWNKYNVGSDDGDVLVPEADVKCW